MLHLKEKLSGQSIRTKILLAVVAGALVVFFSWGISRVVFRKTFLTINSIAQPNHKLALVNDLYQKVSRLEPAQAQEIREGHEFFPKSFKILQTLDSLKALCQHNPEQRQRIDNMKNILLGREQLVKSYLKYRNEVIYNKSLSTKIKELSQYIRDNINNTDSSVVTRQEKTTTKQVEGGQPQEEEKQSFFRRLFHKKKNQEPVVAIPKTITTEDIKITIDTISVAQRDSFIQNIEAAVRDIDLEGRSKVSKLLKKELELYTVGNLFVTELQKLLHEIQEEEFNAMQNKTQLLGVEFNKASVRIGAMLLLFLLIMAVLVYMIFSDISKSNRYKAQLVEAKEKAEEGERVKQRFLANMSHEIRTPLQSIIGFSEQLMDKEASEKRAAEIIHRSSEHLLQIVNEVLDYSRIVSGKFVIEQQNFDMRELIAEVADTIDMQTEHKHIRFIFKAHLGGSAWFIGDAFRLKQILYNLLGNAVKFTSEGEVSFIITSHEVSAEKSEFVFEIKDTGVGISHDELKKIFNAFEQASESTQRLHGGTGLGLGIARSLVEIQGGSIKVQSEPGKGSAFTVKLRYPKSKKQRGEEAVNPEQTGAPAFAGKILLVDDDAFIVQLCTTVFEKHHFNYVAYSSPQEVLDQSWDPTVNLVLLDIRLPGMTGTELCQLLKQRAGAHVRFVALTAQALPDERTAILQQGFSAILLKPFREKELVQLVNAGEVEQEDNSSSLNLENIEALCMHDPALIANTLDVFINDTTRDLQLLKHAMASKNNKTIVELSHRLSAKTGQVGAADLSGQLKALERRAKEENKTAIAEEEASELCHAIDAVVEDMRKHRQRLAAMPQYHI